MNLSNQETMPKRGHSTTKEKIVNRRLFNNKMSKDALAGGVKVLEGRLYYNAFAQDPRSYDSDRAHYTYLPKAQGRDDDDAAQQQSAIKKKVHFFSIDSELVYWNFFLDFGPLNLGQLYNFCKKLNNKIQDPRYRNRVICFYSNTTFAKRANAMYLLAAWQVLYARRTPEEAIAPFKRAVFYEDIVSQSKLHSPRSVVTKMGGTLDAIPPFHDASPCDCSYDLNILDCLRGLSKARAHNFFNFDNFDIDEYEHFEQVENGDLNWIAQGKFLAFAGPQFEKKVTREGCYTLTPEHYAPYFKSKNVGLVCRLNKRMYDENVFKKFGIDHYEHYYLDGSCPSMPILNKILQAFEAVPADKGIAVHCKAGLGRTGTCIGAYIMKHYKFTAREVIGWMRICRPGMVIGPQQHFLEDIQERMWRDGDLMNARVSRGVSSKRSGRRTVESLSGIKDLSVDQQRSKDLPADEDLLGEEYDPNSEAVRGRAGQADALLSSRRNKFR